MALSSSSIMFHSTFLSHNDSHCQNPPTMSLITSPGDMNFLEVICEKQIKVLPLSDEESACSFTSIMHYQEWTKYFMILDKPVYINLVKDFWKHVNINYEDRSIFSCIFGIPLNITPFTIARAIGCKNTGFTVDYIKSRYLINEELTSLHNTSSGYEPLNPENLLLVPKTLFKLLLTNFLPRGRIKDVLTHDDRVFIFLLMTRMRVNLPQTIFDFLLKTITNFKNGDFIKPCVPFGRVLSEIFFLEGIVDGIKKTGPKVGMLKNKKCDVFSG